MMKCKSDRKLESRKLYVILWLKWNVHILYNLFNCKVWMSIIYFLLYSGWWSLCMRPGLRGRSMTDSYHWFWVSLSLNFKIKEILKNLLTNQFNVAVLIELYKKSTIVIQCEFTQLYLNIMMRLPQKCTTNSSILWQIKENWNQKEMKKMGKEEKAKLW